MIPVTGTTATISAQNSAPSGSSPTPLSFIQELNLDPTINLAAVSIVGTYTGALTARGTVDGVNWSVLGPAPFVSSTTGLGSATIASTVQGIWYIDVSGLSGIRISPESAFTGSIAAALNLNASGINKNAVNSQANGVQVAYVAAVTPTAVKASAGFLARVIVLTAGSGASTIYDNASAASGNIVLAIPATPTIGTVYTVNTPVANGIYVAGAANSSALSVLYD